MSKCKTVPQHECRVWNKIKTLFKKGKNLTYDKRTINTVF